MEKTKHKLPQEAVQLYNLFIHGDISRRAGSLEFSSCAHETER
jgi:hypothetical protein